MTSVPVTEMKFVGKKQLLNRDTPTPSNSGHTFTDPLQRDIPWGIRVLCRLLMERCAISNGSRFHQHISARVAQLGFAWGDSNRPVEEIIMNSALEAS